MWQDVSKDKQGELIAIGYQCRIESVLGVVGFEHDDLPRSEGSNSEE